VCTPATRSCSQTFVWRIARESFFAPPPLIQFGSPFFFVGPLTAGHKKAAHGNAFLPTDDALFARRTKKNALHHTIKEK
jgi:hypothetical protein